MQEPATACSTEPPKPNVEEAGPEAEASRSADMPCILTEATTFGLRPSPQACLGFMVEQGARQTEAKSGEEGCKKEEATDLLSSNCTTKSKCEANAKDPKSKRPTKRGKEPTDAKAVSVFWTYALHNSNSMLACTLSSQDCQSLNQVHLLYVEKAACMEHPAFHGMGMQHVALEASVHFQA